MSYTARRETLDKEIRDEIDLHGILKSALLQPDSEQGRKEALKRRREHTAAFLMSAGQLLREFPDTEAGSVQDVPQGHIETEKTKPVTISTPLADVKLRVERTTTTYLDGRARDTFTSLTMQLPEGDLSHIFSVEQSASLYLGGEIKGGTSLDRPYNTKAKNEFGRIASNEEVERGRNAISHIGLQLRSFPSPAATS